MKEHNNSRFIRLEAFDDDRDDHVWVHFAHTCPQRSSRGQEDRVEFFTGRMYHELNLGYCAEGCCNVIVPMEVWRRWVRRTPLEKAVQRARAAGRREVTR